MNKRERMISLKNKLLPEAAIKHFRISGTPVIISEFGSGHINSTYRVQTDDKHVYILQRINKYVFTDPKAVMENVGAIQATPIDTWIDWYSGTVTPRWGWVYGTDLSR